MRTRTIVLIGVACALALLFTPAIAGAPLDPLNSTAEVRPERLSAENPLSLRFPGRQPASPGMIAGAIMPEGYRDWSLLAFQSAHNQHDWEIYTALGDGSEQANLTNHPGQDVAGRLNHGATRVAFASNRHGRYNIFTMDARGGGITRLTDAGGADRNPAWSHDGSRIAFQSVRDGQSEIYVMNADGSAQTRLTYHGEYDGEPAWSPDGTRIAFTRQFAGQYRIWVMNADGSSPRPLSNQPLSENPAWSPDGSRIAYDSDGDGNGWQEIWLLDMSTGGQWRVYEPGEPNTDALTGSWSPDGAFIAFTRVHWLQYEGDWYWDYTSLEAWAASGTITLVSGFENWAPDWQSVDVAAPKSAVLSLPPLSRASGFDVRWGGTDVGAAGIASYDVQFRPAASGEWTPWRVDTTETAGIFTGAGGQTFEFRARARDHAGNIEDWPAAPDASTTVYAWQLTGRVTDNRGVAIQFVPVSITPAPLFGVRTAADGSYTAYLPAGGTYSLSVNQPGYTPLQMPALTVADDRRVQHYLPPTQNLVSNGGFEAGTPLPAGWVLAGPADAFALSPDAHLGERSLLLGRACDYPCLGAAQFVGEGIYPDLASDSAGTVYLLWSWHFMDEYGSVRHQARVRSRPAGGAWSDPVDLGLLGRHDELSVRAAIAVDDTDVVHVVMPMQAGLVHRSLTPGGSWSPPQPVAGPGGSVDLAADHQGGLHVIYRDQSGSLYYLERLPSGSWRSPAPLSGTAAYGGPSVAAGPDNSVHFIYQREGHVFYRWRNQGGSLEPEQRLSTDDGYAPYSIDRQTLAVASDGTVHAVFDHFGNWRRQRMPGGGWSFPAKMDADGTPFLAIDQADNLHLAGWGLGSACYYRGSGPAGAWKPPVPLSGSQENMQAIAVDSAGRVHLASWMFATPQGVYYLTSKLPTDAFSASASQSMTVPAAMHRPTLTAEYASSGGASPLTIWVDASGSSTKVFSGVAKGAWQLAYADLSAWAGREIKVRFQLDQQVDEAYTQIILDGVTLGEWPTPIVTGIEPSHWEARTGAGVLVTGQNFMEKPSVRIGPVELTDVTWVDENTLHATLPPLLSAGAHDVWVTNPGGAAGALARGFRSGHATYAPLLSR